MSLANSLLNLFSPSSSQQNETTSPVPEGTSSDGTRRKNLFGIEPGELKRSDPINFADYADDDSFRLGDRSESPTSKSPSETQSAPNIASSPQYSPIQTSATAPSSSQASPQSSSPYVSTVLNNSNGSTRQSSVDYSSYGDYFPDYSLYDNTSTVDVNGTFPVSEEHKLPPAAGGRKKSVKRRKTKKTRRTSKKRKSNKKSARRKASKRRR